MPPTSLISSPPSPSDLALDLKHVAKTYRGKVHALRGINMQVDRGAVFGLLGPNGAGKSTLVKIMLTVIRASRCDGTMLGARIGDKAVLARVGYLPEHHKFPDYLSAAQVLDFYGALAKLPRRVRKQRAPQLLDLVGLKEWGRKKVKGFSKGMRQRLGVANALMNDPDLIVLDEPTDGVDPVGRRDIRNILLELKRQGKTVFINSHLLSELEMVCDQVAILVQGLVSAQGTMDELTADSRRYEIEVLPPPGSPPDNSHQLLPSALADTRHLWGGGEGSLARLPEPSHDPGATPPVAVGSAIVHRGTLPSGTPILIERSRIEVGSDDAAIVQPLIDALRAKGFTITSLRPVRASLEDLFMKAVTDPNTGRVLAPGALTGRAPDTTTP